ncbi:hypothetical protein FJV76_30785 [Mesorhizobium sp. WSM4303]|uniref:hypothetical protein n=1 Tax=unclassified Mesorhizobium TaxID=325217 RepID=UPI00115F49F5|nr:MULTISPECIES: hypothetical protein [unclassified Mesorhizobium]TRC92953.1 hypothetical protein FJV77_23815 [Mesorhizobium sp. WSM4306]TRC94214.1 hypothetical protein FJV76_30785 [Mesorhizobium sp. WSM4303]
MSPDIEKAFRIWEPVGKALHKRVWPALSEAQQAWKDVVDLRIKDYSTSFDPTGDRGPMYPTIYLASGTGKSSVNWHIRCTELGVVTVGPASWAMGTTETWPLAEFSDEQIKTFVARVVHDALRVAAESGHQR